MGPGFESQLPSHKKMDQPCVGPFFHVSEQGFERCEIVPKRDGREASERSFLSVAPRLFVGKRGSPFFCLAGMGRQAKRNPISRLSAVALAKEGAKQKPQSSDCGFCN